LRAVSGEDLPQSVPGTTTGPLAVTPRAAAPGVASEPCDRDHPAAPPFSRDFLAGTGAGQHRQIVAELLVSELVTRAVTHARTTARLSVSVTGSTARIEVTDDGPGQPELRDPDPGHGGYGLWLVDWLARSWGVNTGNGQDKTVWFTLLLSAAPQT